MTRLHVALVAPEIHWNTGNAGRTCLAAGAQLHLVEPLGFSLAEREVRRAGLDYWERVAVRRWDSLADLRERPAAARRALLLLRGSEHRLLGRRIPLAGYIGLRRREPRAAAASSESAIADRLVRLPMADREMRSLNLSTCVGDRALRGAPAVAAARASEPCRRRRAPGGDRRPPEASALRQPCSRRARSSTREFFGSICCALRKARCASRGLPAASAQCPSAAWLSACVGSRRTARR